MAIIGNIDIHMSNSWLKFLSQVYLFFVWSRYSCKYACFKQIFDAYPRAKKQEVIILSLTQEESWLVACLLATLSQSEPENNGNGEVLSVPQAPSDCLVSYLGHLWEGGSYSSAEKQSVYSTVPGDWTTERKEFICFNKDNVKSTLNGKPLQLVDQFIYHCKNRCSRENDVLIHIG